MRFKVLLTALCVLMSRPGWAIRPADDVRQDAKRFGLDRKMEGRPARLSSAQVSKALSDFNGRHPKPMGAAALGAPGALRPAQLAASFLNEARDTLGLDPASLVIEKQTSIAGHKHVLYRQTYRGLPVEFSRVKVHMDERGGVLGIDSGFEPDLRLNTTPKVSAQQAALAVARDAGVKPSDSGTLVVLPSDGTSPARLAWKFKARAKAASWIYYIDANTREVAFRYNNLRFVAPPVCLTSGTVMGMVFDIDPTRTPGPVARPFNHERVYVVDASTFAETTGDPVEGQGFFCSGTAGKIFTQLQGSFVNVSNFVGPSAHYDNGSGVWSTVATPVSSPHPYPGNAVLISTIDISGLAPTAVKFLPVFSSFNVGAVSDGAFGEGGDVTQDDQVAILDASGNPVASYAGNRGAFNGTAVPGKLMRLQLKSASGGTGSGYDVSLSSYLTLSSPTSFGPTGSFTWNPASHTSLGLRSEISLFYHLNLMHDFFMAGVDISSAAFIGKPVNAVALMGNNITNAFYDPEYDNLFFGDVSGASPSDLFTDDATVPHHEYVHYLVEKIFPIQNFGQAGAISEGNADYFSATSLNDSSIGLYVNEGFGNTGALRELNCPSKAACQVLSNATWQGEIHQDSIFLSQALWDIRKDRIALQGAVNGQACADGLAFQTLLFFPESFQEYLNAMRTVDSLGAVPACGLGACGGVAASCVQSTINAKFTAHGLGSVSGTNDPFDTASSHNNGFETAVDISTLSLAGPIAATIYPAGELDFFTFGAGPGRIDIKLTLPPEGPFYSGYTLTLFDRNHKAVAAASPVFDGTNTDSGLCKETDCTTTQQFVTISYSNPSANQFYIEVAGGPTISGLSNSGVNNLTPYSLKVNYQRPAALVASLVSAQFDNDTIGFSVQVTTFVRNQFYNFAYAQLRDQAQNVVANTLTHFPPLAGDFLVLVSSSNASGTITGRLKLVPGFATRYPSIGTVHVEVFGYDVAGSTVSLGMSQPLPLSTNQAELTAYNNVFNPARGEKATVKFELPDPGHVRLRLYTLNGTFISTLADGEYPAGKSAVDWYGRNFAGNIVASGIYLLHMDGPGFSRNQKIAVVK